MPKYPEITVELSERDGNAFMILSRVMTAMKKARVPQGQIEEFINKAKSSDYDALLSTCMEYVNVI